MFQMYCYSARLAFIFHSKVSQNIEYVIKKFEASDLKCALEFKMMLQNVKLTHAMLSEHLDLDPWEVLWDEANNNTTVGRFQTRVAQHVFTEVLMDILPRHVFNSMTNRFVIDNDGNDEVAFFFV